MRIIPYLFVALALAILAGSVIMQFGTCLELIHPTEVPRHGKEISPVSSYWLIGIILNFVGSSILLVSFQFLRETKKTASESLASNNRTEDSELGILVTRPVEELGVLLLPLLILLAIYQIPFVVLFGLYHGQFSQTRFACFGAATVLLVLSYFIIRAYRHRMAVGDLHLELDDT